MKDKLERIQTGIKHTKAKKPDWCVSVLSIAAVHRWLYIFSEEAGNSGLKVSCYDSVLDIWTDIPVSGHVTVSSVMFENIVYFAAHFGCWRNDFDCKPKLFEYDLLNNTVRESMRPFPPKLDFHVSVIDVTKWLESYSDAPLYYESDPSSESEDSDNYGDYEGLYFGW